MSKNFKKALASKSAAELVSLAATLRATAIALRSPGSEIIRRMNPQAVSATLAEIDRLEPLFAGTNPRADAKKASSVGRATRPAKLRKLDVARRGSKRAGPRV